MRRKLIGLIHWWMQLAPIRHQHWCVVKKWECEHEGASWVCDGVFCLGQERKDCPGCEAGKPCRYGSGRNFSKCDCGLGGYV